MGKTKYKIIGITAFLIGIILLGFFIGIILTLKDYIEKYVSHDHHMEPENIANIEKLLATIIIVLLVVGILFIFNGFKKILAFIEVFINVKKVEDIFLKNNLTTKENLQKRLFVIATAFGFLLPFLLPIINQPKSEGIIEEGSSWLFLIAGCLLIISSTQITKSQFTPTVRKNIKIILITIAVLFIIMFGEEISWGQRIFEWESKGVFKEYNVQSETNFHNFFNSLFDIFYPIIGLGLFLSLFFLWFFPKENRTYLVRLIIPHPSSTFLVFMMACLSYDGHSEIFEELLAIFAVLYSIRIYYCLKFPKVT